MTGKYDNTVKKKKTHKRPSGLRTVSKISTKQIKTHSVTMISVIR